MRIRKRLLTPSTLDHSTPSTPLEPSSSSDLRNHSHLRQTKPSDLQLIIVKGTNGWICSNNGDKERESKKRDDFMHLINCTQVKDPQVGISGDDERLTASYRRNNKNMSSGAKACVNGISISSSSSHKGKRWCNGENNMMRAKRNKRWVYEKEEEKKKKKKKIINNGGAMMEGSRCSRVNGRGWRCCQQTLVGYSLCEHHLGKGRLRSISNVRALSSVKKEKDPMGSLSLSITQDVEQVAEEEDRSPLLITKKWKIGMVKARSISSLLGQTQHSPKIDFMIINNIGYE